MLIGIYLPLFTGDKHTRPQTFIDLQGGTVSLTTLDGFGLSWEALAQR